MRARRVMRTVAGGAALAMFATDGVQAQQGGMRSTGRVTLTSVGADNLCVKEAREGASLARLPEGLALLRMRSDLEAASRLETVRPASSSNRRTLELVRREVDSLARVLERVVLAAPRRDLAPTDMDTRRLVDARVRQLTPSVEVIVESALRRVVGTPVSARKGYFGVTISSVPLRTSLQSGYIVSYCDYPVVEAVDPGSPAERAGLSAGDTIIAFNGRDVRVGMVDYSALLAPDANVRVRTRRDGRTRETTVRVAASAAPVPVRAYARAMQGTATMVRVAETEAALAAAAPTAESMTGRVAGMATAASVSAMPGEWFFEQSMPEGLRGVATVRGGSDSSRRTALQPRGVSRVSELAAVAPSPPVMLTIFANADDAMVGGAQLRSLGAEFRAALSLPEGVLVMQVLRGTPASVAGLREGDVIRSANGRAVRRVEDVRLALELGADARSIALRVVRNDAPERTVTMTW